MNAPPTSRSSDATIGFHPIALPDRGSIPIWRSSPLVSASGIKDFIMRALKSSFVWQFAGGFVLGAIGLVAMQPAEATREMLGRIAPSHHVR